ncbi:MAG TPA: class I SAM-dependent methyltransferase [Jatrophihabitantaceae bacterium]|jgi:SAM-dependent methyltransferase
MDASGWDERYRSADLVWGAPPNRFVAAEFADAQPGRALDLACGEGRNALWLAGQGWRVTAVDFSSVAIEKARELDAHALVDWQVADATTYSATAEFDLALVCYLQLEAAPRRSALRAAAAALAPGGTLFVIGHDSRNIADGTGGPQDPRVLYTADDLATDIAGTGLRIERADEVLRPVEGAARPAIDALLKAIR